MGVTYEEIGAPWFEPPAAALMIDEHDMLTITGGYWPDVGGAFVHVEDQQVQLLADDNAVLLAREGEQGQPGAGIVLSDVVLPYGALPVAGGLQIQPHVDLLAWREADGWHVKRLVQEG